MVKVDLLLPFRNTAVHKSQAPQRTCDLVTEDLHHPVRKIVTVVVQQIVLSEHNMVLGGTPPNAVKRKFGEPRGWIHDFGPTVGVFWAVAPEGGVFGAKLGKPAIIVNEAMNKIVDGELKRALLPVKPDMCQVNTG